MSPNQIVFLSFLIFDVNLSHFVTKKYCTYYETAKLKSKKQTEKLFVLGKTN
jgi:hypothetical protein